MRPYKITQQDHDAINAAIADKLLWESPHIVKLKKNIKKHYRKEQNEQCCYCKRVTTGEFNMVLDIEHILPKSNLKFRKYMFNPLNLSVACKRCNMKIKNKSIAFISPTADFTTQFHKSSNYLFIHPHTDNYWEFLRYEVTIKNDLKLIKYIVVANKRKGTFTYSFFKLNELEIDSFNSAQGVSNKIELSDKIDSDLQSEIEALLVSS